MGALGARHRQLVPSRCRLPARSAQLFAVFLLHQEDLVRIDGPWWDDFFELVLLRDSQVPAWHDLVAAQRGQPLRALLVTFNERPLPCMCPTSACRLARQPHR